MPRFARLIFSLLVTLSLFAVASAHASEVQWLDKDTLYLADYSVKLTRPNNTWRVLPGGLNALIKLRYDRSGQNIAILVRELPPFKMDRKLRKASNGKQKNKLIATLLKSYEAQGIQFYDSYQHENRVFATGTNANTEIVFLQFQLISRSRDLLPIVLEMTIPRERYHDFNQAFLSVAESFGVWIKNQS